MKNVRKDNKGFSLVELIVVVLIMAIIAVALAPQVLRWVDNARKANDLQLMGTIMTACDVALTNEEANAWAKAYTVKVTCTTSNSGLSVSKEAVSGKTYSGSYDETKFKTLVAKSLPSGTDSKTNVAGSTIEIVISNGVTQERASDDATAAGKSTYKVDGTVVSDKTLE